MISLFDGLLLILFAWTGYRLWAGTTSIAARGISLASLLVLAWQILG